MGWYQKKPIVVQAVQWLNFGDHEAVVLDRGQPVIETREGKMCVSSGDWIITETDGKFYPCPKEVFEATYAAVEQSTESEDPVVYEWFDDLESAQEYLREHGEIIIRGTHGYAVCDFTTAEHFLTLLGLKQQRVTTLLSRCSAEQQVSTDPDNPIVEVKQRLS